MEQYLDIGRNYVPKFIFALVFRIYCPKLILFLNQFMPSIILVIHIAIEEAPVTLTAVAISFYSYVNLIK
jgi:hypothetical protein